MLETDKAFIWTDEGKRAFTEIKHFLTNQPILAYPDFSATFILDTNASDLGVGAVLSQKSEDDLEHPIAYYSRGLNKHENNYLVTRKKLLAAIESMEHYKCYYYGRKFLLCTDHAAIQWLKSLKNQLANSCDGSRECLCLNLLFNIALENDMQTQMGYLEFYTRPKFWRLPKIMIIK